MNAQVYARTFFIIIGMAVQRATHIFLMSFYALLVILAIFAVPESSADYCGNVFETTASTY